MLSLLPNPLQAGCPGTGDGLLDPRVPKMASGKRRKVAMGGRGAISVGASGAQTEGH